MHLVKLLSYLFIVCLFLTNAAYSLAQDTTNASNDNHKIEVGLGAEYLDRNIMDKRFIFNSIHFELIFNYSFRLTDYYRLGLENRFGNFFYAFSDVLICTNEFDIAHLGKMTFQLGFGVGLAWYYVDGRTDEAEHYPDKHKFAVPLDFRLGFEWRQSDLISIRIALGVTDNLMFFTHYNNNAVCCYPTEKDTHTFNNGIAGNLSIRVGFHL